MAEANNDSAILVSGGCGFIGLDLMTFLVRRFQLVRVSAESVQKEAVRLLER